MLKSWLYLLIDKISGKYIYLDSNNVVQHTSTPTALVYTPDGWQKKSIAWERDLTKFGLVRSFTISLGFVGDGKILLDKIAIQSTFDSAVQLLIQKLNFNTTSNAYEYIDFYIGEISLSQLESEEVRVSVPISEGGVSKQLKANESTVYEFDLDSDPDAVIVKHDGMNLYDKANYVVSAIDQKTVYGAGVGRFLPAAMISRDGNAAGFAGFSNSGVEAYNAAASGVYDGNPTIDQALFYTSQAITGMRIHGSIKVNIDYSGTPINQKYALILNSNLRLGRYDLIYNNPGIAYLNPHGNSAEPLTNTTNTVSFDFDITINTLENEYFFIYAIGPSFSGLVRMEYVETEFNIEFKSKYKTSYIKALPAWILYKRLVGRITGDETNAVSTILQANQNIVLTSGDAVRGIVGSKIKTSLADFFKFARVVFASGMGVESEKIVIEELSHFCNVASPINLGTCKDFKWKFAEELLFNTLKIGYSEKAASNTDNVNGKYAFNNSHLYTTPITSVSKPLELLCPYAADPFYIEIIRINLAGKTTTDNTADNEIVILNTESENISVNYLADFNNIYTTGIFGTIFQISYIKLTAAAGAIDLFRPGLKINITDSAGSNSGTYQVYTSAVDGNDIKLFFLTPFAAAETGKTITLSTLNLVGLKRETYTNTDTGLLDIATVFNIIYLTPKRILKRWMTYINSCLFQFYGVDLTFESTEKNRELKTDNGAEVIDEDAPETIGADRLFKAIDYNIITEVDDVVPTTLSTNPNKGLKTINPVNNKTFTGILVKGAMAANEETAQSFRLLASPDDDENNLL